MRYIRSFRIYIICCSVIPVFPFYQRLDKLEFDAHSFVAINAILSIVSATACQWHRLSNMKVAALGCRVPTPWFYSLSRLYCLPIFFAWSR